MVIWPLHGHLDSICVDIRSTSIHDASLAPLTTKEAQGHKGTVFIPFILVLSAYHTEKDPDYTMMGPTTLISRSTAVRNHIWDGDSFRPLKPRAPFEYPKVLNEPIPPLVARPDPFSGPKLLPRREVEWILTAPGLEVKRQLARNSAFMVSSWETLLSSVSKTPSVDKDNVLQGQPNICTGGLHTPNPRIGIVPQHGPPQLVARENRHDANNVWVPSVRLKAASVMTISRYSPGWVKPRDIQSLPPNILLCRMDTAARVTGSQSKAEKSLQQILATHKASE